MWTPFRVAFRIWLGGGGGGGGVVNGAYGTPQSRVSESSVRGVKITPLSHPPKSISVYVHVYSPETTEGLHELCNVQSLSECCIHVSDLLHVPPYYNLQIRWFPLIINSFTTLIFSEDLKRQCYLQVGILPYHANTSRLEGFHSLQTLSQCLAYTQNVVGLSSL